MGLWWWGWANADQLFISWQPGPFRAPGIEGTGIHPFDYPLTWEYITDRIPYQWYFERMSFNLEHMLVYRPTASIDRDYATYTIRNANLTPLPSGEGFTWLRNGSLSFVFRAEQAASEEIYLTEYPFDRLTKVTNLAETFGSVVFARLNGTILNWSPDAIRVIFSIASAPANNNGLSSPLDTTLYVYDQVQGTITPLCIFAEDKVNDANISGNRRPPASYHWSPDSQYVAFVHEGILYIYNLSEKKLIRLLEDVMQIYTWQS